MVIGLASCDYHDRVVDKGDMPTKTIMFISDCFPGCDIVSIDKNRDLGGVSYDVVLEGDVKIEFNRSGDWTSVDCEKGQVPDSVLPQEVLDYVRKRFARVYVVEIERGVMGYDVKLSNDLELDFDKSGKFVRVD